MCRRERQAVEKATEKREGEMEIEEKEKGTR